MMLILKELELSPCINHRCIELWHYWAPISNYIYLMLKYYRWEKFEDANGVIRRQKSKTDNTMAKKKKEEKGKLWSTKHYTEN
jgi:hypothetical protein